jgi:hypothetical protein
MALNDQGFKIINFPAVGEEVLSSFANLSKDIYIGNGNRYRRFSQYRLAHLNGRWNFELLPHRPYMTFSKYNKVAGGIKRFYEPLQVDFTPQIEFAANHIPLDTSAEWQINVHQYRVIVAPGVAGVTVPEGPHQDGHEFVMIAVLRRNNIIGGAMSLLPLGGKGEAFFKTVVQEGQAALLADRIMFHDVTEIEPIETEGFRDIFVVAFSRWAERWHGEEFEKQVEASEEAPVASKSAI